MARSKPQARNTVVLILGASEFPEYKALDSSPTFAASAEAFEDYLRSKLGIPATNICSLFNSVFQPGEQLQRIRTFIRGCFAENPNLTDIIFYYCGHGAFLSEDDYVLALRCTNADSKEATVFKVSYLVDIIRDLTREMCNLVLLDACYSAAALGKFTKMSEDGAVRVITQQFSDDISNFRTVGVNSSQEMGGTVLFCAAGPRKWAKAPIDGKYTMFSGALKNVLEEGDLQDQPDLTLKRLAHLIEVKIRHTFGKEAVKPQVHVPIQGSDDLLETPYFPNPAFSGLISHYAGRSMGTSASDYHRSHLGHLKWVFTRPRLEQAIIDAVNDSQTPILVLTGLPGVGKTIILHEVSSRLSSKFDFALVLAFSGAKAGELGYLIDEINTFLLNIGRGFSPGLLQGQPTDRSLEILAQQLRDLALLLIVDAADAAPTDQMQSLLSTVSSGPGLKVIMTARSWSVSGSRVRSITIPQLTVSEQTDFIDHYALARGMSIDRDALLEKLPVNIRDHPQALGALLANLEDVPLDLLLLEGLPAEARAPLELIKSIIASLGPAKAVLALLYVLDGQDLVIALDVFRWPRPAELSVSLRELIGRSLVTRVGSIYQLSAVVRVAICEVDPDLIAVAVETLERRLRVVIETALASAESGPLLAQIVTTVTAGAARLSELQRWSALLHTVEDAFLDLVNVQGYWKEYWLLLGVCSAAATSLHDKLASLRFSFRLARKSLQMNDSDTGQRALADIALVVGTGKTVAHAELLSHRAFFAELEGATEQALRLLKQSSRIYKLNSDVQGASTLKVLIGNALLSQARYQDAKRHFDSALAVLDHSAERLKTRVDAELGLAFCDLECGAVTTAMQRLNRVEAKAVKVHYRAGLARAHFYLALAADRLGDTTVALESARRASDYARTTDRKLLIGAELLRFKLENGRG